MSDISRKDFLKNSALASSLAFVPGLDTASRRGWLEKLNHLQGEAKNIIFMVSDGMSSGTFALADLVNRRQFGSECHWVSLYNNRDRAYHRGLMDMASLDSPVTDSAAASSSWGGGKRIQNGAINMLPDGRRLKPICQIFRDAGKKTGLVTTTRMTHATPAGFAVNVPDRNMEDEIALQYLKHEYDLLMGGGSRHFDPDEREDGKDLWAGFRAKGYQVVRKKSELTGNHDRKLLGIFSESHLPYTIDRRNSSALNATVPTIAEMTETALKRLDGSSVGFLLQVEGGRVDHGAHGNDAAALIYDQIEFDEAVSVALDFIADRDDTLLIITTDHGNANPGLSGAGERYSESAARLDHIQHFTRSNDWILSELDEHSSITNIRNRVEAATAIGITKQEASMIKQSLEGSLQTVYRAKSDSDAVLGSVLANYLSINWLSTSHTADYVELAALGPGIEQMDAFTRNTELFDMMVKMAGVREYAAG